MIRITGSHFPDEKGRRLILRGVNLGGITKVPFHPNGATYSREGFFEHRQVSFVGRPFPLEEADGHLGRLRAMVGYDTLNELGKGFIGWEDLC